MNKFGEIVTIFLTENNLKQQDIVNNCPATKGAVSQLLNRDNVSLDKMEMIADALNCDLELQLIKREPKTIPIKCSTYKVSAGFGFELGNRDNWVTINVPDNAVTRKADFALIVVGDSMEPKYYQDDIILVKEIDAVDIGDTAIYRIIDKGYVKVYKGDRLVSLNPKYEDIIFSNYEIDDITCIGKVIGKV